MKQLLVELLHYVKKYRLVFPRKSERSEKIAIKTLRKIVYLDDAIMKNLLNTAF